MSSPASQLDKTSSASRSYPCPSPLERKKRESTQAHSPAKTHPTITEAASVQRMAVGWPGPEPKWKPVAESAAWSAGQFQQRSRCIEIGRAPCRERVGQYV